ncbi:MAG: NUDIX domain-containing protein [Fidelibacterota bacterium]
MNFRFKDLTETRLTSSRVFKGKLLDVWSDTVRLPNGETSVREYVRHPGAVVMIPVLDDDRIVLIEQFRYATGDVEIELPAGTLDPGESPPEAVERELLEETGYAARTLTPVVEVRPCMGYSTERMWIYLATDLTETGGESPSDEFIRILPRDLATCLSWVQRGKIKDVKAIIGLLWAEKILSGQWSPPTRE